jgi:soluble lytic murein transglycosylase-like protein
MKEPDVEPTGSLEIEAEEMGAKAASAAASANRLDYHAMEVTVAANNQSGQSDELIIAQAYKESRFDPSAKNSSSSATGLLQMTKGAVAEVNRVNKTSYNHSGMSNAAQNVEVGTQYLKICIDRKKSVSAGLDYYGTGAGYSTKILAAETALQAHPADPMAELIRIIGKP